MTRVRAAGDDVLLAAQVSMNATAMNVSSALLFALCLAVPLAARADASAPASTAQDGDPSRTGDNDWDCEPGARSVSRDEAVGDRRLEKWFCPPRRPARLVVGLSHRGVLSETGSFSDKLGFEAGVRLFSRFDLALGVGQMFKDGETIALDGHGRLFLFNLPGTGGPYVGGGYLFNAPRRGYFTLGFFGGSGLFFELQFRGSQKQPVAVIPAFGLRAAFP